MITTIPLCKLRLSATNVKSSAHLHEAATGRDFVSALHATHAIFARLQDRASSADGDADAVEEWTSRLAGPCNASSIDESDRPSGPNESGVISIARRFIPNGEN